MAEGGATNKIFPPSKRTRSDAWVHFGYCKGSDGKLIEDNQPVCRKCQRKVSAKGGNTSNLTSHLRDHHPQQEAFVHPSNQRAIWEAVQCRRAHCFPSQIAYLNPAKWICWHFLRFNLKWKKSAAPSLFSREQTIIVVRFICLHILCYKTPALRICLHVVMLFFLCRFFWYL